LSRRAFAKILKGLLYSLLGLSIFLAGVNMGFMGVGATLGQWAASLDSRAYAVGLGLILGIVTILAEPAVHVLTDQIETVTAGYVKKNLVLATLSLGVGLAVALSIARIIIPQIQLWHYLLPGYIIALSLAYVTPKLFVGIAFDSGGVASGPMTATFILAFSQGVADSVASANVLRDAFGMIALVAMTPIISLEVLGLVFRFKSSRARKADEVERAAILAAKLENAEYDHLEVEEPLDEEDAAPAETASPAEASALLGDGASLPEASAPLGDEASLAEDRAPGQESASQNGSDASADAPGQKSDSPQAAPIDSSPENTPSEDEPSETIIEIKGGA
jgi:hypothetical protein